MGLRHRVRKGFCTDSENPCCGSRRAGLMAVTLFFGAGALSSVLQAQAGGVPDCPHLEQWAAGLVSGETFSVAPKVELSTLLADSRTVPLFGNSVVGADGVDLNAVRNMLKQCRKAASKRRDKAAADRLYQAMKAVNAARAPLMQMQRVRRSVPQQVQWLVDYRPGPDVPGLLAVARDALQGNTIDLPSRGIRRRPDWLSVLQQAPDYLPAAEIEPLLARLADRQSALEREYQGAADELAAARKELAAVPATRAGLATLDRLARMPALDKVTREKATEFRANVQARRRVVQRQLQAGATQQAGNARSRAPVQKSANATVPVDIEARLKELLVEEAVEDLSIRGLRPGADRDPVLRHIQRQWQFEQGFLFGRDAYSRDNNIIEVSAMDEAVGQLKFIEYFTAPLADDRIRNLLTGRFGKPDESRRLPDGQQLGWKDGPQRLQVQTVNRLETFERHAGYRAKLTLVLWNDDYEDYMRAQNERCSKIRKIPRNQMSMEQSTWFGLHCPLLGNDRRKPGL